MRAKIDQWPRLHSIFVVAALLAAATGLVYATGGSKYVYAHIFYLPILFAAYRFATVGGLVAGLAGGVCMGPWMPLDVAAGVMQSPENWLARAMAFALVGTAAGVGAARLRRQMTQLVALNRTDAISGLPNRRCLLEAIEQQIAASAGSDTGFALVVVDILGLGRFNGLLATLGHTRTYALCQPVARLLQEQLPTGLTVYHLAALRFAVCLPAQQGPVIHELHRRIASALLEARWRLSPPIYTEPALGAAHYPTDGTRAEELLQAAMHALLEAEQRDWRVAVYHPHQREVREAAFATLLDLSGALDSDDQLSVYVQPQHCAGSGRIRGGEALIRWHHPRWGPVAPGAFVPIAEATYLMVPLTAFVVQQTAALLARLQRSTPDIVLSCNASVRNLEDPEFPDLVARILAETGAIASGLEIELTESALIRQPERVEQVLGQLHDLGVRLALDDFGTGFSSLSYLHRLPIDVVKLDRSFTAAGDQRAAEIVESVVDLVKDLGHQIVAEGVETEEQRSYLTAIGVDFLQGYLLNHPLAMDRFEQTVMARQVSSPSDGPGHEFTSTARGIRRRPSPNRAPFG